MSKVTPFRDVKNTCKCPACGGFAQVNCWEELLCGAFNSYNNIICACGYWEGDTGETGVYDYLLDVGDSEHADGDDSDWGAIELEDTAWLSPSDFLALANELRKAA